MKRRNDGPCGQSQGYILKGHEEAAIPSRKNECLKYALPKELHVGPRTFSID
jgi:hypothetical protein